MNLTTHIPGAVLVNGQKITGKDAAEIIRRYGARRAQTLHMPLPLGQDLCDLISRGRWIDTGEFLPYVFEVRVFFDRVFLTTQEDASQIELNLEATVNLEPNNGVLWVAKERSKGLSRLLAWANGLMGY
jgi:hypothetical protein